MVDGLCGPGLTKRQKSRTLLPHLADPIYSLAFVIRRIGEPYVGVGHRRELETLSPGGQLISLSGRLTVSDALS